MDMIGALSRILGPENANEIVGKMLDLVDHHITNKGNTMRIIQEMGLPVTQKTA